MKQAHVPFTDLLASIVDNRGRTCPTSETGLALIATNCVRNEALYPVKEKVRYVDQRTYDSWFRGHPVPGDILFVCKGSPGNVAMVPDPVDFCIAQDMVAVRPDPARVYPNYLFAALRSTEVQHQIAAMHVGTLIPHFKKGDFASLMIPIPSTDDQVFIGDVYVALSKKIEANRRLSSTALELVQVNHRRVTGAQPVSNVPLGSLIDINRSSTGPGKADEIVEYIDIASVSPARVDRIQRIEWRDAPSRARRLVQDGDVIYSTVRPGRRAFALLIDPPRATVVSTGFATLSPRQIGSAFLLAVVSDPAFADYLDAVAQGSAYPAVSPEVLGRWEVGVPDGDVLDGFEASLMPILRRAAVARREEDTLVALRDALLPALLSGRLHVPNAERATKAML